MNFFILQSINLCLKSYCNPVENAPSKIFSESCPRFKFRIWSWTNCYASNSASDIVSCYSPASVWKRFRKFKWSSIFVWIFRNFVSSTLDYDISYFHEVVFRTEQIFQLSYRIKETSFKLHNRSINTPNYNIVVSQN